MNPKIALGLGVLSAILLASRAANDTAPVPTPTPAPPQPGKWILPGVAGVAIPKDVLARAWVLLGVPDHATFKANGYSEALQSSGNWWRLVRDIHNDGPDGPKPYDHPGTTVFVWRHDAAAAA